MRKVLVVLALALCAHVADSTLSTAPASLAAPRRLLGDTRLSSLDAKVEVCTGRVLWRALAAWAGEALSRHAGQHPASSPRRAQADFKELEAVEAAVEKSIDAAEKDGDLEEADSQQEASSRLAAS
jgi:hypothetical protein